MSDPWEDYEEALARIELLEAENKRLRSLFREACEIMEEQPFNPMREVRKLYAKLENADVPKEKVK